MNEEFKDYYKILGVTPRASLENIRKAAERELSQNWNNAIGRLEVQKAYEILSDPDKKKEYDEEFNKRLSEMEVAKRNATSYSEYIEASNLYPELANVEVAPELTDSQKEDVLEKINDESVIETSRVTESQVENESEEELLNNEISSGAVESNDGLGQEEQEEIKEQEEETKEKEEEIKEQEEETKEQEEETKEQEEETKEQEEEIKEQEEEIKEQEEETKEQEEIIMDTIENVQNNIIAENSKVFQEEKKENKMEQNLQTKQVIDKKRILKNIALIGGPLALGVAFNPFASIGILGSIIATVVLAKKGKLKLQKVPKGGKITKVQTGESKIIEEYNEKLESKIRQILNKPLKNNQDNYELQIAMLKYENQLEMLEKRIEFKLNESQKKGYKAYNALQIRALQHQYQQIIEKLQLIYKNQSKLSTNKSKDKLTKLHESISKNEQNLNAINAKVQSKQKPYLDEIKLRQQQIANSKDEKEIERLKKEIDLLKSQIPQADQILNGSEKIQSSKLRMQINMLEKEKQELIEHMVGKTDSIARQQWREAEEIEQKSR